MNRYSVTLCGENVDVSDQIFTVGLSSAYQVEILAQLVKSGGTEAGLIKPALIVESPAGTQVVSRVNNWEIDHSKL